MTRSPGLNSVTPAPTLSTVPANSPPGENGNARLGLVLARDDQRVEEIQSRRRDLGHDLAGTGDRVGNIREHEVVGGAVALTENGFHGRITRMVRGRVL